jgi:hypothetical protein
MIKCVGKEEYFYEPILETYKKYPNHAGTLELWKSQGLGNKLLWPQFHGREHLNIKKWMRAINSDDQWELEGFKHNVLLGLGNAGRTGNIYNYMAAFEYSNPDDREDLNKIAHEGLILFESIFGFKSRSFVAPCSVRGNHLDMILRSDGILYHQCGRQFIPHPNGSFKTVNKYWGQKNKLGQVYWRRNVNFEPSRNPDYDWVDSCMEEIRIAFKWSKPAVINSHRVNYMGGIFCENRDRSLKTLIRLIHSILSEWHDVEFRTSDELGDIIISKV